MKTALQGETARSVQDSAPVVAFNLAIRTDVPPALSTSVYRRVLDYHESFIPRLSMIRV
jgi:hypothetical protein